MKRDFLKLSDFSRAEHHALFERTRVLKSRRFAFRTLEGRTVALIFEKASTRTRLSFEAAMAQLGGVAMTLPTLGSQMGRGEPLEDTARVVSRYADAIVFRTHADERLAAFARASTAPVVNGLSDGGHPVQLLADLFTIEERLGAVAGKTVAFVGDCASNMARSYVEAAPLFDFELRLAAPEGYRPAAAELKAAKASMFSDPAEAVAGAEVVVTDVWTSMGQEAEREQRLEAFGRYQINETLLGFANPRALVMHCLPAHRGEEITDGVLDGEASIVLDQAENRLHAQKAIILDLLGVGLDDA